jgi:hypothetical protein
MTLESSARQGLDGEFLYEMVVVVYDAVSIFDGMFVEDLIYEGYSEICMKGLIGYEPWSVCY